MSAAPASRLLEAIEPPCRNCWTCAHNVPGAKAGRFTCARLILWRTRPNHPDMAPPIERSAYEWENRQSWSTASMPPRQTEDCPGWAGRIG